MKELWWSCPSLFRSQTGPGSMWSLWPSARLQPVVPNSSWRCLYVASQLSISCRHRNEILISDTSLHEFKYFNLKFYSVFISPTLKEQFNQTCMQSLSSHPSSQWETRWVCLLFTKHWWCFTAQQHCRTLQSCIQLTQLNKHVRAQFEKISFPP